MKKLLFSLLLSFCVPLLMMAEDTSTEISLKMEGEYTLLIEGFDWGAAASKVILPVEKSLTEVNGKDFGLLDARKVILTDDNYGSANVNWPITRKRIKDFFRVSPGNYVITGFIGASAHGCTTTLGRGGSDYTATVFATILNAENVIKWTDVNGIMTADPGKVPDSYSLNKITYDQLLCLSKFGSNVLVHENSIQKLQQDNIPLIIKNTFNTNFEGTLVTNTTNTRHKAISHHTDCHIVSFQKNLKISKEVYNQIKANNYLFFRIKNDQFNQTDSSVYLVSDECLKYLSTIYCCKNPGCNSCKKPKDSKVIYESITLITIATNQKDKIFEEKRILDLLNKKGINILCSRLFKNGISLILQQEEAKDTLNYLHNEIVLRTEEKVC